MVLSLMCGQLAAYDSAHAAAPAAHSSTHHDHGSVPHHHHPKTDHGIPDCDPLSCSPFFTMSGAVGVYLAYYSTCHRLLADDDDTLLSLLLPSDPPVPRDHFS